MFLLHISTIIFIEQKHVASLFSLETFYNIKYFILNLIFLNIKVHVYMYRLSLHYDKAFELTTRFL